MAKTSKSTKPSLVTKPTRRPSASNRMKKVKNKKAGSMADPLSPEVVNILFSNFMSTHVAHWTSAQDGTLSINTEKEINTIAQFTKAEYCSYIFHRGKPRPDTLRSGQFLFRNKTPLPSWDNGTGHGQDEPMYRASSYFEIYGMPFLGPEGERLMVPMHIRRELPVDNTLFTTGFSPAGREYKLSKVPYTVASSNQIKKFFAQGGKIPKGLIDPHYLASDLAKQLTSDLSSQVQQPKARRPIDVNYSHAKRALEQCFMRETSLNQPGTRNSSTGLNHKETRNAGGGGRLGYQGNRNAGTGLNYPGTRNISAPLSATQYWSTNSKNTPSTTPWDSHRSSSSYPPPSYYSSRRASGSVRITNEGPASSRSSLFGCCFILSALTLLVLAGVFMWGTWDKASEKRWLYVLYLIAFMIGFVPLAFVPRFFCQDTSYRAKFDSEC